MGSPTPVSKDSGTDLFLSSQVQLSEGAALSALKLYSHRLRLIVLVPAGWLFPGVALTGHQHPLGKSLVETLENS